MQSDARSGKTRSTKRNKSGAKRAPQVISLLLALPPHSFCFRLCYPGPLISRRYSASAYSVAGSALAKSLFNYLEQIQYSTILKACQDGQPEPETPWKRSNKFLFRYALSAIRTPASAGPWRGPSLSISRSSYPKHGLLSHAVDWPHVSQNHVGLQPVAP